MRGPPVLLAVACAAASAAQARDRVHYIAADAILWDYAPSYPDNLITGAPFTEEESVWLTEGDGRIGRRYFKAVYREYTDGTFTMLKPRAPEDQALGILGPILRAEVGDTLTVVFQNNLSIPAGIHPHGVLYEKASEGAHYAVEDPAGPSHHGGPETGAHVAPLGGRYVYRWDVPERAGPGPADPDSVAWLYHAHDHEGQDIYAGLVGAIVVTRAGRAAPDGRPKDVDRELFALFMTSTRTRARISTSTWPGSRRRPASKPRTSRRAIASTPSTACSSATWAASSCAAANASAGT